MSIPTDVSGEVPGTVSDVDFAQIEKWLSRDLKACIALLSAIDNDVDLRRLMAQFLHGRVQNFKNRPVVDPSQSNLFPKV